MQNHCLPAFLLTAATILETSAQTASPVFGPLSVDTMTTVVDGTRHKAFQPIEEKANPYKANEYYKAYTILGDTSLIYMAVGEDNDFDGVIEWHDKDLDNEVNAEKLVVPIDFPLTQSHVKYDYTYKPQTHQLILSCGDLWAEKERGQADFAAKMRNVVMVAEEKPRRQPIPRP